jgi:hypothetical protein
MFWAYRRQAGSYDSSGANFRLARHPGVIAITSRKPTYTDRLVPIWITFCWPTIWTQLLKAAGGRSECGSLQG